MRWGMALEMACKEDIERFLAPMERILNAITKDQEDAAVKQWEDEMAVMSIEARKGRG